jgi:hypothetical protein
VICILDYIKLGHQDHNPFESSFFYENPFEFSFDPKTKKKKKCISFHKGRLVLERGCMHACILYGNVAMSCIPR